AKRAPKPIDVIRIGNPWLVGKNVERIVPLYALHNFCAPRFKRDPAVALIHDLVVDAPAAFRKGFKSVAVSASEVSALQQAASGLLSPDGRVFRASGGGASDVGALFPIVGGLLVSSSDDGLGRRLREVMEQHDSDWRMRLDQLLAPQDSR